MPKTLIAQFYRKHLIYYLSDLQITVEEGAAKDIKAAHSEKGCTMPSPRHDPAISMMRWLTGAAVTGTRPHETVTV